MADATRSYESPLRTRQARETHERILEALTRVLARGVAGLSVPAVAEEAGVSVPTVYRHFGTKEELVAALAEHLVERQGFNRDSLPTSLDEFVAFLRDGYEKVDGREAEVSAALTSEAGKEARRITLQGRERVVQGAFSDLAAGLTDEEFARLRRAVLLFTTSEAIRFFREFLGLSRKETVETVVWAVRALARGAEPDPAAGPAHDL